ncbi:MAG: hypothetical protein J6A01_12655 [Proteobacteria bacterium]|nr:hypothetical protein [Pseudomonadota bacterium]
MKNQMIQLILILCSAILFSACATTGTSHEMSAKDEARYAQAIENAEATSPSPIQKDTEYTVVIGESAAQDLLGTASPSGSDQAQTSPANDTATLKPEKQFSISKADYDAFFAQSPAIVLGRMTLDPITDGGALLGYRVKDLKPFAGVDLVNEDIIVGINGKLPKNPDEYFNAWENCKKQSNCTVNIQRGVDRFNLEWNINP